MRFGTTIDGMMSPESVKPKSHRSANTAAPGTDGFSASELERRLASARKVSPRSEHREFLNKAEVAARLGISESEPEFSKLWLGIHKKLAARPEELHYLVSNPQPIRCGVYKYVVKLSEGGSREDGGASLRLAEDNLGRLAKALDLSQPKCVREHKTKRRLTQEEGYFTLAELVKKFGSQPMLETYWPAFTTSMGNAVRYANRSDGARITIQTDGVDGKPIELTLAYTASACSRPNFKLLIGPEGQQLDNWLKAAQTFDARDIFRRGSFEVLKVESLATADIGLSL